LELLFLLAEKTIGGVSMSTKLEDITKIGRVKAAKIQEQGFTDVESLPNDEAKLKELGFKDESIVEILAILNPGAISTSTSGNEPAASTSAASQSN